MSSTVAVAVRGSGPLAELLRRQISGRADLAFTPNDRRTAAGAAADVLIYLPDQAALNRKAGAVTKPVIGWLTDGIDVVSTLPASLFDREKLRGACRAGGTTFHGSGGLSAVLPVRFSRAFAAITRDIESVSVLEHRQPAGPDAARAVCTEAAAALLAEAAFGRIDSAATSGGRTAEYAVRDDADRQIPVRYEVQTVTPEATGRCTIEFHGVDRSAAILAQELLDVIVPVHISAPGILHHELDINQVELDDRLARRSR
ncbi:hypothetical protein [Skermania piniformis]|uniref:Dihydrodipicolinate reductase n=1 Tax=Skermania pinensis TaxID=39122 RepID=A0ABX8S895_9ACTN|nr:hypothetical protein [Skermania piniformis]QXQ14032.1 hypothetical protein KV203_00745 [Skermania piniformis]